MADWTQYKIERNKTVKILNKVKKEYYENEIEHTKNDPKQMFKTVKNLLKNDKSTDINFKNIKFDNDETETRNDKDLANKFNNFFIDSIENIVKNDDININRRNLFNLFDFDCRNYFNKFEEITLDDLYKIVNSLDSNKGSLDGINKRILLNVLEARGKKFVDTLNLSLSSGVSPDKWKNINTNKKN